MATVLVVDDSAVDRKLVTGLLERCDKWHVIAATLGKQALDIMKTTKVDIVVADLVMPEMDGFQLVAAARDEFPLVPVIILTGKGSEEIAVKALNEGAASYVTKKRLASDLPDTVARVLGVAHEDHAYRRFLHRVKQHECVVELDNDVPLLLSAVRYLQQLVRCMPLADENERLRVGLALEEAFLNAYYHGNLEISSKLRESDQEAYYDLAKQRCQEEPYCGRRVYVEARVSPDEAVYVIRDEGPGFDPSGLPDPTAADYLERPYGRGLLLMRSFMDEVVYSPEGNQVTLIKRPKPHPEEVQSVSESMP